MLSLKQSSTSILSFPSPAEEFESLTLGLNEELIKHTEATAV